MESFHQSKAMDILDLLLIRLRIQKVWRVFLENYEEISRQRAAPNMNYSYKMPEIEELMQGWSSELLQCFESILLPTSEIDLSLEDYARVICSILDIPVKGNIIESLHLLFSLYLRFVDNPHFRPSTAGIPSS